MEIDFEAELAEDFHDGFDDQYDNDVIARLKKASHAIKTSRKFTSEEEVDDFFADHGAVAGESSSKDAGNLLHSLVDVVKHNEIKPEHVELLLRRLVERYPDLLKYPNKDGHSPIFMAIRASQHQLVDYMVSTCLKDKSITIYQECLDDVLTKKVQEGKTCLHAALTEKNFNSKTTKMLIENASDEALAVLDDANKTPMHYAVQFPKCTEERMELIDLFIRRDGEAIQSQSTRHETFLDQPKINGSSVYQEHQKSRESTLTWWKNHGQARENAKREQTGSGDGQGVRDLKSLTNPRDGKDVKDVKEIREARTPANFSDREKLRWERKREEELAEAAKKAAGGRATKHDWVREREPRPDRSDRSELATSRGGSRERRTNQVDGNLRLVTRNTGRPPDPEPNTPVKRSNPADVDGRAGQTTSLKPQEKPQEKLKPNSGKATDTASIMRVLTKNSDEMLLKLKLHYMRTRNPEMVISFLYGTNMDDIQISFDYDCLPREIVWNEFEQRLSGFKFDRVLQYVTFPDVEVRQKGRKADMERAAEEKSGIRQLGALGRKDVKFFLKWLYDKGVRHIINLSVEDSGERGGKVHSDQAIQDSLERFVIEQLDWRKTDLDPETILHVSSSAAEKEVDKEGDAAEKQVETEMVPDRRIKQLYLRWSGSNAVLRAWSEPEGLPLLPQLQKIYLVKPPMEKTYDNVQWINKKVNEFQARFNRSRKLVRDRELTTSKEQGTKQDSLSFGDVKVIATNSNNGHDNKLNSTDAQQFTTASHAKGVDSHKWLDSTASFASEMTPFWQNIVKDFLEPRQNIGTPEQIETDVVVALIDDGVDMFDTDLSNQVLEGKSFDFHGLKMRPPFSSAKGHGTVMASMILRVCPMAKLYPIRLKTFDNENGKSNIDPEYAAQAIQAALDKKATIISMSWTLPMTKGKSEAKDRLHSVLQKAVDKKVLMICSAPDEGKFTELDYPSGPWRDRFFRIGAAHADGTVFRWTPDDGITYVLPGVDVIKEQVGSSFKTSTGRGITKRVADFKYETGSSVATALAAGLAAMIIYCVKASILAVKTANQNKGHVVGLAFQDNGADLIADPEAMKRAFATLGKVTPNNFIPVWEELDKATEILKSWREHGSSPDAKQACIDRFVEFGHKLANSVSSGTF